MFTQATFNFLDELASNNDRTWFEANKPRYDSLVREPALEFIAAMGPVLETFAPRFCAEPRKVGGSLMRVFRDTRFSRDKTPYKTNIGIQFRHILGKDIHAPGFYLHISMDECFFAVGCWHPDSVALGHIRNLIANNPDKWFSACNNKNFVSKWKLWGDSLTRPPRGYDQNHSAITDLKRKDFVGMAPLLISDVIGSGLVKLAGQRFSETVPFMKFLCEALGVPY